MSEIQVPRFENVAARFLGVKGPGTLREIDPAVVGTVELGTRACDFELRLLQGVRSFGAYTAQAAVAGQYSYVALYNLATTPGKMVVLEEFTSNQSAAFGQAVVIAGFTFVRYGIPRDPRVDVRSNSALYRQANAGVFATDSAGVIFANQSRRVEWVIPPGWAFWLRSLGQNVTMDAGFSWYERDALPSELT